MLLSSPKRWSLRDRVGCVGIGLEIKPFLVHLAVFLPVNSIQLHSLGNAVDMCVPQIQRYTYSSCGTDCQMQPWAAVQL